MVRFLLLFALVSGCSLSPIAPALNEVAPDVLMASEGGDLELRGTGCLPAGVYDFDRPASSPLTSHVSASLEQGDLRVELDHVKWVNAQLVKAEVPPGLPAGTWSVRLVTPHGDELVLTDGLRLTAEPPDAGDVDGGDPDGGDADGGPLPCQTFTYFDGDDDGFGLPDSGALLCGRGRAVVAGDCDDADPLTSPAAREICNDVDDNCNGLRDEGGVCPADAGLIFTRVHTLDSPDNDFLSTSAFGPEQVWIAGGTRLFLHDRDAGFIDRSANCPMGLNAVWAEPSGRVFIGGGNNGVGRLTTATPDAGCASSVLLPDPVAGLVGFPSADGGVQVEVVMRTGRRASWDGVGAVTLKGAPVPSNYVLYDAHGAGPDALYAVGGTTGANQRPAVFRLQLDGGFVAETIPPQNLQDGQLHGVWAVSATEVVAVGDNGLVLRRVGGAWERINPPSTADYTTVRAFSIGRFTLSTVFGYLRQWNGAWAIRYTDQVPVRDLTAYDEEHFWLVGDNGLIIKGPVAP